MNKYETWWNNLSPQTREYLKRQPIWHDKDLYKATAVGAIIGFVVGLVVGYQWAFEPVVRIVRPLIG